MDQFQTVHLISLLGFLILAGSAFASYHLSWKKGLQMALIWAAIFAAVTLLFSALGG